MSDAASIEHPAWLTGGDFTEADEPLRLFAAWFAEARQSEPVNPEAMTLSTVDAAVHEATIRYLGWDMHWHEGPKGAC